MKRFRDSNSVEKIKQEVISFEIEKGWRLLQVVRNKIQLKFENFKISAADTVTYTYMYLDYFHGPCYYNSFYPK